MTKKQPKDHDHELIKNLSDSIETIECSLIDLSIALRKVRQLIQKKDEHDDRE